MNASWTKAFSYNQAGALWTSNPRPTFVKDRATAQNESEVTRQYASASRALVVAGLSAQNDCEALGVRLRGNAPDVCISIKRCWKLYNVLGWLVEHRRMAVSKEVKQIVGAFDLRLSGSEREAFGVLRSAHDFARARHRRKRSMRSGHQCGPSFGVHEGCGSCV